MSLRISSDCDLEFRKVKPCTRSSLCQMRSLIPAGYVAIPKEGRDLSTELESLPPVVCGYAQPTEASSMRLLLSNDQRNWVLFDRVGNRSSEL